MLLGVRTFAGSPGNVAPVRRFAADCLAGHPDLVDDARLLVSELFTNAISHGRATAVRVAVTRLPAVVRVAVTGVGPSPTGSPQLTRPNDDHENGRGIALVDYLSNRWGATGTPTGMTVWFDLAPTQTSRPGIPPQVAARPAGRTSPAPKEPHGSAA